MNRQKLIKKADIIFSSYIRLRDKGKPCCTCGNVLPLECGHFISRKHMATRWTETNSHGQCIECNREKHGNLDRYEDFIKMKYGGKHLEGLKNASRLICKPTSGDLEMLIAIYQNKIKELKKL